MPTLAEKVKQLQASAVLAAQQASFWQKTIQQHGEQKAEAFYCHLGLNHIERKGVEWEGLTLSREPKEHEKLCVKGIANAQESAKESIGKVLLTLRSELIEDGLKGIKKLKPATYHELTLQASSESRESLRDRLVEVHRQGRILVAAELEHQQSKGWMAEGRMMYPVYFDAVHQRNGFGPHDAKCIGYGCKCSIDHEPECKLKTKFQTCSCEFKAAAEDEFDDLDELVGVTLSRVVNDTQSRIIASAAEGVTLGLSGSDLLAAIQTSINTGSVTYIDRSAGGLSNRVIAIGRHDEMSNRSKDIERFEYSSLLDVNTCFSCASLDGTTAQSMADLPDVPLSDCDGGSLCRCFIVAIAL